MAINFDGNKIWEDVTEFINDLRPVVLADADLKFKNPKGIPINLGEEKQLLGTNFSFQIDAYAEDGDGTRENGATKEYGVVDKTRTLLTLSDRFASYAWKLYSLDKAQAKFSKETYLEAQNRLSNVNHTRAKGWEKSKMNGLIRSAYTSAMKINRGSGIFVSTNVLGGHVVNSGSVTNFTTPANMLAVADEMVEYYTSIKHLAIGQDIIILMRPECFQALSENVIFRNRDNVGASYDITISDPRAEGASLMYRGYKFVSSDWFPTFNKATDLTQGPATGDNTYMNTMHYKDPINSWIDVLASNESDTTIKQGLRTNIEMTADESKAIAVGYSYSGTLRQAGIGNEFRNRIKSDWDFDVEAYKTSYEDHRRIIAINGAASCVYNAAANTTLIS